MTTPPPGREEIVALLAAFGERAPENVGDTIDSLELAWLIHELESRYELALDLSDDHLARMSTVPAAVDVIREAMAGSVS